MEKNIPIWQNDKKDILQNNKKSLFLKQIEDKQRYGQPQKVIFDREIISGAS